MLRARRDQEIDNDLGSLCGPSVVFRIRQGQFSPIKGGRKRKDARRIARMGTDEPDAGPSIQKHLNYFDCVPHHREAKGSLGAGETPAARNDIANAIDPAPSFEQRPNHGGATSVPGRKAERSQPFRLHVRSRARRNQQGDDRRIIPRGREMQRGTSIRVSGGDALAGIKAGTDVGHACPVEECSGVPFGTRIRYGCST